MSQAIERQVEFRIDAAANGQLTLDPVEEYSIDEKGRLHSIDHEAVRWEDGTKAWFIDGVKFDPHTWESVVRRTITPSEAIKLPNIEQRRVAIQMLGMERVLHTLAVKAVACNGDYALYEVQLYDDAVIRLGRRRRSLHRRLDVIQEYLAAKFLKVKDSTTGQWYFLRVPPEMVRCVDAVAWTFGLQGYEYCVKAQT